MDKTDKIYIAGHTGMVGSSIVRLLQKEQYQNLVLRTHEELDLRNQEAVKLFFQEENPNIVIIAAALVGGIQANRTRPAEFLYDNLMINANLIHASHEIGVKKMMVLGSSCIYPKQAEQPMKESAFLAGLPEPTNEGYSIGKISAMELARFYHEQYGDDFISCMPTNIYGVNDSFDNNASHVIPAMIRKFYEAKISNQQEVIL